MQATLPSRNLNFSWKFFPRHVAREKNAEAFSSGSLKFYLETAAILSLQIPDSKICKQEILRQAAQVFNETGCFSIGNCVDLFDSVNRAYKGEI